MRSFNARSIVIAGILTVVAFTALLTLVIDPPFTGGSTPVMAQATSTVSTSDEIDARKRSAEEANRTFFDARPLPAGVTPPPKTGATAPASCPRPTSPDGGRFHELEYAPGGKSPIAAVTQGEVTLGSREYNLLSGSLLDDPQRGAIAVLRFRIDPCAELANGTLYQSSPTFEIFEEPTQSGPVTMIDLDVTSAVIEYRTEGGQTGRFNIVTGKFIP